MSTEAGADLSIEVGTRLRVVEPHADALSLLKRGAVLEVVEVQRTDGGEMRWMALEKIGKRGRPLASTNTQFSEFWVTSKLEAGILALDNSQAEAEAQAERRVALKAVARTVELPWSHALVCQRCSFAAWRPERHHGPAGVECSGSPGGRRGLDGARAAPDEHCFEPHIKAPVELVRSKKAAPIAPGLSFAQRFELLERWRPEVAELLGVAWFDPMATDDGDNEPEVEDGGRSSAWLQGRDACAEGQVVGACPYPATQVGPERSDWISGWWAARELITAEPELVQEVPTPTPSPRPSWKDGPWTPAGIEDDQCRAMHPTVRRDCAGLPDHGGPHAYFEVLKGWTLWEEPVEASTPVPSTPPPSYPKCPPPPPPSQPAPRRVPPGEAVEICSDCRGVLIAGRCAVCDLCLDCDVVHPASCPLDGVPVVDLPLAAMPCLPSAHEYAALFPMADEETIEALAEDIRANGLQHPIVQLDGLVLDGRHRLMACVRAGVEPVYVEFVGADPLAYVVAANLHRRHLTPSQRALIGAKLEGVRERARERQEASRLRPGEQAGQRAPAAAPRKASEEAAAIVGASPRLVEHASKVLRQGSSELVEAVDRGELPVSTASDLASLTAEKQREILASADPQVLKAAAKEVKAKERQEKEAKKAEARRERQEARGPALSVGGIDLQRCDVEDLLPRVRAAALVHADPPWRYRNEGVNGAAQKHYETLCVDEIFAHVLQAGASAAPDAYLLLWVTSPMLEEWMEAATSADREAWPWRFLTTLCWTKSDGIGIGFHARGDHELLLVYAKGSPSAHPVPRSVHHGPRLAHSEKPEAWLAELVTSYTEPGDLVLDLYAGRAPLARACRRAGRRYVGAELSEERYLDAMEALRLADDGQQVGLGLAAGVAS